MVPLMIFEMSPYLLMDRANAKLHIASLRIPLPLKNGERVNRVPTSGRRKSPRAPLPRLLPAGAHDATRA